MGHPYPNLYYCPDFSGPKKTGRPRKENCIQGAMEVAAASRGCAGACSSAGHGVEGRGDDAGVREVNAGCGDGEGCGCGRGHGCG